MSNEKTTQLNRITSGSLSMGDLIPVVKVSATSSATGETMATTVGVLAQTFASGGYFNWSMPQQAFQTANGLAFNSSITPAGDINKYCYGPVPNVGDTFTLMVRGFVPSGFSAENTRKAFFGVGPSTGSITGSTNYAYIGIESASLIADIEGLTVPLVHTNYFDSYAGRVFQAVFVVSQSAVTLYANGVQSATNTRTPEIIASTVAVMGNGTNTNANIDGVIYEAAIYTGSLTANDIENIFYSGVNISDARVLSYYSPENLNPGPSQWLDSTRNGNHLLLPTTGALATNPEKEFSLRFVSSGTSSYLGNGTERDVLPNGYVLTDCFMYSVGSAILSVGSSPAVAPYGASNVSSWNNNRVAITSAVYKRNNLELMVDGVAHKDKTLYVFYSASTAPCTFSFEGYVADYGSATYTPPAPVVTSATFNVVSGSAFSYYVTASNYPVYYTASAGLPSGLVINTTTGLVSGTIGETAGTYTASLLVNNLYSTGSGELYFVVSLPATPTPTPTPTATPTPTPSATPTPTPGAATPTPTPTATPTPTPTGAPPSYAVSTFAGSGIDSISGGGVYSAGSLVNLNATVTAGYTFSAWSGDTGYLDFSTGTNPNQFTMPATNVQFTASANPVPTATPTPTPTATPPPPTPTPTATSTPTPTPTPVPCYFYDLVTDGYGNGQWNWTTCAGVPDSDSEFSGTPTSVFRTVCAQENSVGFSAGSVTGPGGSCS